MATVANRIIEIMPNGVIDKMLPYDDYLIDPGVRQQREQYLA
jgi:hypothetical protein